MLTAHQQHQMADECNTTTVSYNRSIQRRHGWSNNGDCRRWPQSDINYYTTRWNGHWTININPKWLHHLYLTRHLCNYRHDLFYLTFSMSSTHTARPIWQNCQRFLRAADLASYGPRTSWPTRSAAPAATNNLHNFMVSLMYFSRCGWSNSTPCWRAWCPLPDMEAADSARSRIQTIALVIFVHHDKNKRIWWVASPTSGRSRPEPQGGSRRLASANCCC